LKSIGFFKSRIITSFHGHDLNFPINNRIPEEGYYNNLFEVADVLVSNTPFLKSKLKDLKAPENKIRTLPVAVDTTFFKPYNVTTRNKKLRFITVGRLDELKGQDYGLKVVKELIEKGLELEYILVGSGVNELRLKGFVKEME